MSRRVALLPAGPDPFLLAYWFRNFYRVWADEVDELHVLVCGQVEPEAKRYIAGLAQAKVRISFHDNRLDHGSALGLLVGGTRAELVMFIEDDAYVRSPGAVAARFDRLASVDVIGGPRGSASQELIEAAQDHYGAAWVADTGEAGHALWPCFLFARRAALLATDHHYGARAWSAGQRVRGLNYTAPVDLSADTFVSATYQLRGNGARIEVEGQYRITDTGQMGQWIGQAPWFHIGSLSTGYGNVMADDVGGPALRGQAGSDWARRVSWWERFARTADGLPRHLDHYRAEIEAFVASAGLSRSEIDAWTAAYQSWITWQET